MGPEYPDLRFLLDARVPTAPDQHIYQHEHEVNRIAGNEVAKTSPQAP
jgi:hypothetical protein